MQKNDSGDQVVQSGGNTSTTQSPQNVTVTHAVITAGRIQALTSIGGQQAAIGVLPAVSGFTLPQVSFALPRAISTQSSIVQPVHVSATSLSNTCLVSPQALNIIQRQLSSGIVGLSTVSAQGLQVLQASGSPLTFVTATSPEAAAAAIEQQRRNLLQQQEQKQQSSTAMGSSGTIHHMAMSSPANPMSNPSQSISLTATMSESQQLSTGSGLKRSQTAPGAMLIASTLQSSTSPSSVSTISINAKDLKLFTLTTQPTVASTVGASRAAATPPAGGPSPKKIKLEEKPAPNKEIQNLRYSVCSHKRNKMRDIKFRYREHLTELFYLQGGGNIIEFHTWKKHPSQPLLSFLEGSKLDSDDDSDELQEKRINDEVKVLTSAGSNIPLATPVAISTTLPPSVSALSLQAVNSSTLTTPGLTSTPLPTAPSELQQHLVKISDVKPSVQTTNKTGTSSGQAVASKSIKSASLSPGRSRQQSISSVYENVTGGSQDVIVERAKQEAQVLQRVNELRKEGLWSAKRLPRVQEPPRQKAHWDYLLEEMTWLAADFIQERKWKKAAAKKLAKMVSNHFKEQEQKEMRAEKEEGIKLKKIASQIAKMVKEFWTNIEKVVQYKQTTRLEERKKKALDLHLSFIVDQTEKYSSWLTAGLQNTDDSKPASDGDLSVDSGEEFEPMETGTDDEETIEQEEIESGIDEDATKKEVEALQKESEIPLEELLKTLPKEMLDKPSSDLVFDDDSSSDVSVPSKGDADFTADGEEEEDVEETIDEQESQERKDYSHELDDLKAEGEMSVEELMQKYAGAYDSDFEIPEESSGEDDDDEESSESEKESGESSEEEEEESEVEEKEIESNKDAKPDDKQEDVGLEFLVKKETASPGDESNTEGPGKEFNDIAAAAQSLQPKGYTLETTEVKTKVPFLLKHTLREYQHVGLDWLATMHDKRLNGILADEMGLGKTIQTIALLAHLACDKGTWGPHLIVVPTSVMLNWEMEFKKWCPAFKILTYYGSIKERKLKRQGWTKTNAFHVCITSYKLVVQDHQAFRRKKWKYFILDEAQNIKNFKSQRWQMLLNFSSQRRLLLTGTPLQNSLMELWSLMHFLMPHVFQSHSEFKEWFSNPLTGMIEGSQEYNESLVRRLHKVLRPFLLRRLKNEVEKQMPQKFEHVVMCRLSKRQRYLYDDFMSQTKTKETLATGHFMSVINILMQLRKVCNHPDLFDPRPIVSPFKMEGIVYTTASLATRILEFDPFNEVDVRTLYPNLAEMERDLPAFVAQRIRNLKATGKLIQEVDSLPEPPPQPPPGQLKNVKAFMPSVVETGRTSPVVATIANTQSRPASPLTTVKLSISTAHSTPSTVNSIKLLLPPTSSSSSSTQQTVLIPNPSGSGPTYILPLSSITTSSSTSAAIAQAKLISSHLQSGMLQLVQTSSGHQILTTTTHTSASIASSSSLSSALSTTTALTSPLTLSTTAAASTTPPSSLTTLTGMSLLKCPALLLQPNQQKPVMRVSPFVMSSPDVSSSVQGTIVTPSVMPASTTTKLLDSSTPKPPRKPMKKSELFLESLYHKKVERRQHILALMSRLNQRRCDPVPVYGSDTHQCVDSLCVLDASNSYSSTPSTPNISVINLDRWRCNGYVNCRFAQNRHLNHSHPDVYWRESTHLQQLVHSPVEWLHKLKEILSKFVFVTPSVISPAVSLRVSHPNQSEMLHLEWTESRMRPVIVDKSSVLHPVQSRTLVTFPDLRLIQYDCGKLQTLDLLLRQLKSGQHRVLIFTQMTKMLDVLEAFLNFHGHRYLRLDGTTKVEQRQYLMDRFNADARIFCFILSTRSGGIGVNLTGADTVVFYDSDWNPTMDAQAQDRCHRIGQTRDVHIYRLVSEMTVEENILKKANQKRLLGDLAIEGGNFTTAFFKEQTISDLFAEPSGLESLVEAREREKEEKDRARIEKENEEKERKEREESKKEAAILSQFEQALCKAEDETDAQAAKQVQAEQKAELAEFDENIPWDERELEVKKDDDDISKVEIELAMLDKELTPIERYAVTVMEAQMEPETAEELKMAEEDIENSKKDWELARLKALKEEDERRAELEEDEMLYIYSRDESQMFISDVDGAEMPMWCPPTPPQDDNDIYIDETLSFLYEPRVMLEQSLPPVYVPKAHKKPKLEAITTRKQKQRKEEQPRVPRSLFDKPKEVVMKQRRDAKMQRLRQNLQVPAKMIAGRTPLSQQQQQQPLTPIIAKPEPDPNYPEWLVHEEWALLEAVQNIQKLNPDLLVDNPAQIVNWDFVSDFVSVVGRIFRSAKHCRYQYEYVVLPREDGKIIYNMKQKKTPKSIYKTKNTRPQRTEQLYSQEGLKNFSQLFDIRFAAMMEIGVKRPAAMRQTIVNTAVKPAKHAVILADQGINYDIPMLPSQLAARRAERIAQDKKKQQQQQLQQQQAAAQAQGIAANTAIVEAQAVVQRAVPAGIVTPGVAPTIQGQQLSSIVSVTPTTVIQTNQVPKVTVGPGLTAVSIARTLGAATGNIIVNAPTGLQSGPFAAINKRISQAAGLSSTIAVSANLTPAIRGQRPATAGTPTITMQDLEVTVGAAGTSTAITVAAQAAAAATRSALQTTVTSSTLAAGQKLAAMTATGTAIQPQLVQAARSLTPHQINILRQNQSIIRTQTPTGLQQLRAQKLLSTEQLRAQQLKHPGQKVITQQLLVPVRGGQSILQGKQGLLRATAKMTEEQLQALRMRTQIQAQPGKQLQTAQIIQGQVTPVGQSAASTSQTPIALVKSVSASPVVTVPVTNQAAGIGVPQQRAVVTSRAATVSQIQQQQRMQLLHQQRKAGTQQKVAGLATGKAGQQIPLLIPQHKLISGNQILHQIGLVNKTPGAIQQIITHNSQPTIITQVSQATGQPITQMVAKVSITSGSQTLTPGTPITVTHVSSAANPTVSLSLTGQGAVKTATITSIDSGSAGIQVHPVQPGQKTVAGLTQSLVTAQTVQVLQSSSAQGSQFLQVTPATAQAHSSTAQPQQTTVTVPASLVAATALRATPTPPNAISQTQTPTQISLVSTAPPPTVSTIAAVQVQPTLSSDSSLTSQVIAQSVQPSAVMATVVTQTNQPDSTQITAGQKASPYAMRTRNTKH